METPIILADQAICQVALVRRVREKLSVLLRKQSEPASVVDDLLLAMSEHLANLAEHSSGSACEVYWYTKARRLEIRDNGVDMTAQWRALAAEVEEAAFAELKESGMGMSLIQTLFPTKQYIAASEKGAFNRLILPLPIIKPTVIVVDDDPVFLTLVEAYLHEACNVKLIASAEQLLAPGQLDDVSLVICDVHMPDMMGTELRECLLKNQTTALIPFIFLTGDASEQSRHQASGLEIDDYLTKPIKKESLVDAVQRVLLRSSRVKAQLNEQVDHHINCSLWPAGPWQINGMTVSYQYQVAERGGGDFLFCQPYADCHRYVLGDVMGHGEQAKFHAFAITGFLTGLCSSVSTRQSASLFMTQLSSIICSAEIMSNTLVTLQVIDVHNDGHIEICSAGHPPPMMASSQGVVQDIVVDGPLPGLDSSTIYQAITVTLPPEHSLIFYTDGIVEAILENDDVSVWREKLSHLQKTAQKTLSAENIAEKLQFKQRELTDDVCVLVVQASPNMSSSVESGGK